MAAVQTGSVLDRTVLKEGPLYLVADRAGDIRALNMEGHGLYFRDTRHLSLYDVDVSGTRLSLLAASGELNFMSTLQFANEQLLGQHGEPLAEPRTISIRRNRFLDTSLHERLGMVNYNAHTVSLTVRFTFGSDFRDMFEVRGYALQETDEHGEILPLVHLPDGLLLAYRGRDGFERRTRILFDPPPTRIDVVSDRPRTIGATDAVLPSGHRADPREEGHIVPPIAAAVFELELPPKKPYSVTLHVIPEHDAVTTPTVANQDQAHSLDAAFASIRDSYERWRSAGTHIETDHDGFDQLLTRASRDLRLLVDDFDGNLVPTAGIPWFAVPFGRDSLITSAQTLPLRTDIAAGTLRYLAARQGTRIDDYRDEEPGKILHEVRMGELAAIGRVPHTPYYGSIDSTPLFLATLGEYLSWTGDLDLAQELLPNAERALEWLDRFGDIDGDGFVEYLSRSEHGIRNQGWKDSPDSVAHRDGTLAEPPVALAEVQGYVYAARRAMADLYARLGSTEREREQRAAAERLRSRFLDAFAMSDDDGPYWAQALDRDKRRVETITSNPGHVLWSGLLRAEDADLTVRRLMAADVACGWGIRTLSNHAPTFNPMSYHNGSVWPHDSALIALGMKRAGWDAAACEVASQVFEAGLRFPGYRLPELYCGFSRDRRYQSIPAQYPVSCSPQAWAAGAAYMLLQALLGLEADAFAAVVRFRPLLPTWLSRVSLRRLRVGTRELDVDILREGHRTIVDVLDDGGLRVEVREAHGEAR